MESGGFDKEEDGEEKIEEEKQKQKEIKIA